MKLHWMPWITVKEFARYQRLMAYCGDAKRRKRMRELCLRSDRRLRTNTLKIFPELEGRP